MGFTKKYLDLLEEQTYKTTLEDRYVCEQCLVDHDLIENLKKFSISTECSFCKKTPSIHIDNVLSEINEAIIEEGWVRSGDQDSYDSSEGGFQHHISERREIAVNLCKRVGIENEEFLDLINILLDDEWMIDKPYGCDYFDDSFSFQWDEFKKSIAYNRRFTFFFEQTRKETEFFSVLMSYLEKNNIIQLNRQQILHRGRSFGKNNTPIINIHEYGAPPSDKTKNCRMSPKGISFFYCSSDCNTVVSEIKNEDTKFIGLVTFKPRRNFWIIDLSRINGLPSPFDKIHRKFRRSIEFLNEFIDNISKPINIDDNEHLEYIPTQVISEYIKCIFLKKEF